MLVTLLAVSLVPAASSGTHATTGSSGVQAKKLTITILSRTRIFIPHDLAPKGKENKGDWIRYRAQLLTRSGRSSARSTRTSRSAGRRARRPSSARSTRGSRQDDVPGPGHDPVQGSDEVAQERDDQRPGHRRHRQVQRGEGVLLIGAGNLESVNTYHLNIPDSGIA